MGAATTHGDSHVYRGLNMKHYTPEELQDLNPSLFNGVCHTPGCDCHKTYSLPESQRQIEELKREVEGLKRWRIEHGRYHISQTIEEGG